MISLFHFLNKKMNFKKLSLENLVPYKKNYVAQYVNFERPFGYFDFYKNNIIFNLLMLWKDLLYVTL